MNADTGILLVGHGTRHQAGQKQARALSSQVSQLVSPHPVEMAFLELADPDIDTAVRSLAERSVSNIVSVPILLFAAGHALRDIPNAVEHAASRYGMTVVGQTPVLESCEPILELSASKFRQSVREVLAAGIAADRQREQRKQIGLAMIGRGSRSASATVEMLRFTALRCELTPVAWQTTGFMQLQTPSVEQSLDSLENSGQPILIVQPHLLFEGELTAKLREQVAARRIASPGQKWGIADPLGGDWRLARTLVSLAEQAAGVD